MSYLEQYGKTYENWKQEQAKRILEILTIYFKNQKAINLNDLILHVYQERLSKASFLGFRAIEKNQSFRLNDKKPSPFIKNLCNFLLEKLSDDGYLEREAWYLYEDEKGFLYYLPFQIEEENMTLIDYGVQYFVKSLPSLSYLVSLITYHDPSELEALSYKLAEKELNY
jgi:hypothetical protein